MPASHCGPGLPASHSGPGVPASHCGPGLPASHAGPGVPASQRGPGLPVSQTSLGPRPASMASPRTSSGPFRRNARRSSRREVQSSVRGFRSKRCVAREGVVDRRETPPRGAAPASRPGAPSYRWSTDRSAPRTSISSTKGRSRYHSPQGVAQRATTRHCTKEGTSSSAALASATSAGGSPGSIGEPGSPRLTSARPAKVRRPPPSPRIMPSHRGHGARRIARQRNGPAAPVRQRDRESAGEEVWRRGEGTVSSLGTPMGRRRVPIGDHGLAVAYGRGRSCPVLKIGSRAGRAG